MTDELTAEVIRKAMVAADKCESYPTKMLASGKILKKLAGKVMDLDHLEDNKEYLFTCLGDLKEVK